MLLSAINAALGRNLLGEYPATVRASRPDGTLDVEFDDLRIRGRGITSVSVNHGMAETLLRVDEGARCLVGFAGGDPDRPYIAAFEFSKDRAVLAIGSDPRAVARDGDVVEGAVSSSSQLVGVVGPPSPAVAAAIAAGSGSVLTFPPLTPFLLTGAGVTFSGRVLVPRTRVTA